MNQTPMNNNPMTSPPVNQTPMNNDAITHPTNPSATKVTTVVARGTRKTDNNMILTKKQKDGFEAAEIELSTPNIGTFEECRDQLDIPEWVTESPDKSKCRYNHTHKYWFETPEDYANGLSQVDAYTEDSPPSRTRIYRFGRAGSLRVTSDGGKDWVSLGDAGLISGLPTIEITGPVDEFRIDVRGVPGYPAPGSIRLFANQFDWGLGILLDALPQVFENVRGGSQLIDLYRRNRLADPYVNDERQGDDFVVDIGLHAPAGDNDQAPAGMIAQHVLYDPYFGELRAIPMGVHLWFSVVDVSRLTRFDPRVVIKLAGKNRTVKIPNAYVFNAIENEGEETYVRHDAVQSLLEGKEWKRGHSWGWHNLVSKDLEGRAKLPESRAFVRASTLRRALGTPFDLESLFATLKAANPDFLEELDPTGDFRIPIGVARDIATRQDDFAGVVIAHLIADGGYLHGGPIDEPADVTLERFHGLLPDSNGRVEIRKIWEFMNGQESFDQWFRRHDEEGYTYRPVCEGMVSASDSWCNCIWDYGVSWSPARFYKRNQVEATRPR